MVDELLCILGHHNMNVVSLLGQEAGQVNGLVGGNRTGDSNHDVARLIHAPNVTISTVGVHCYSARKM